MSLNVRLPEELAARVEALAAKRGVTADQVVAEMLHAQLPAEDALEAFIGSGASGNQQPLNLQQTRREVAERKLAKGA